ncbi:calcium load-activated calcium channel isoform X3 [Sagmatias obliquidens]|uniref:calcium load-activated calcium channel isoform X3 n=1 Tax=Sagmatias obliquidens TaxID=3371155 RepID=UPI000F4464BE|nr:calcium load-activated calcium channel isoform X3 [Lagenorhynchus obliquidens]
MAYLTLLIYREASAILIISSLFENVPLSPNCRFDQTTQLPQRQEEKLKNNNRDLSMVRMKSMFAIGFCFTALMGMFNSIFDGRVVAKLPFTPLSYIQGLSHRNLLGDDTTDCSFIFLYILCTMSIRQNIQKILGLAPSRAATKQAGGFLGPPPPSGKFS